MSRRQHVTMSQREPVILEKRANSSRAVCDDSHADFKALSALSIQDLATLRYFVVQIEEANDRSSRLQQRYRRHRDKSARYFYGLDVDFRVFDPDVDPDVPSREPRT